MRIIGGLTIVVMWVVRDAKRHDFMGVSVALLVGGAMAVICYFWVRPENPVSSGGNL